MKEETREEVKVLLNAAIAAVEAGDEETAKAKIKEADDKIKLPLPGTGSNGLPNTK